MINTGFLFDNLTQTDMSKVFEIILGQKFVTKSCRFYLFVTCTYLVAIIVNSTFSYGSHGKVSEATQLLIVTS